MVRAWHITVERREVIEMMRGYYDGLSWFWILPMMLLVTVGTIALLFWVVRAFTGSQSRDPAIETLRRRLAAGEISQDEFEKTRRSLL
jgi:uncharacterized membrane protein